MARIFDLGIDFGIDGACPRRIPHLSANPAGSTCDRVPLEGHVAVLVNSLADGEACQRPDPILRR